MSNDLTIYFRSKQNGSASDKERKCAIYANKLSKGNIVYKRDTGMAHKIGNVSFANGIEHYNLICMETNSSYFLSKFALEKDYAENSIKVENFGIKMVKRLSEMWGK